jgi:PEP-CTERM motif-containing protein
MESTVDKTSFDDQRVKRRKSKADETNSGQSIQAGAVPESGSLGLLALGAAGLLAWRERRAQAPQWSPRKNASARSA